MRFLTLVLLTISLLANAYFFAQLQSTDDTINVLKNDKQVLQEQYEIIKRDVNRLSSSLIAMKHPDNQVIKLNGTALSPKSNAVIHWNETKANTYIDATNLPAPKGGKQYQVWVKEGEEYQSVGVFNYQTDKENLFQLKHLPKDSDVMVTLEPPAGSSHPNKEQIYVQSTIISNKQITTEP